VEVTFLYNKKDGKHGKSFLASGMLTIATGTLINGYSSYTHYKSSTS